MPAIIMCILVIAALRHINKTGLIRQEGVKMNGYEHQTLPVHLYRCFLAMADKFQTSNTVNFKFPFWPLLHSLHKSVILFALGYRGKKASLKCHCDQSSWTPPQAQCGLRVYICNRWHLECKPKNWAGLLCPVVWPLSFSTCSISLLQTSVSRRALSLREGRAVWAGVPAQLICQSSAGFQAIAEGEHRNMQPHGTIGCWPN